VSGRFLHDPASSIASYRISAVSAGVDSENPQDLSAMRQCRFRPPLRHNPLRPCALGDQVNAPVTIANGISRC
jgi:hypothetical protein